VDYFQLAKRSRTLAARRRRLAVLGFLSPNLAGFLVFTIFPIAASLIISFYEWPLLGKAAFVGFDNFVRLFTHDYVFWQVSLNTVYFVVGYIVLNLVVSLGLAVWLTSGIKFAALFRFVFFLPVVAPMVANSVIWRLLYVPQTGVFASALASLGIDPPNWLGSPEWAMPSVILMSVWAGFGYNMLIFVAGIQAIPASIYDAAQIDGVNAWTRFTNITFPMISPSIFFATVMTLISALKVFEQPYILTGGGPGSSTTTVVFYLYQQGFQNYDLGYASSIAWMLFLVIMFVTFIQFWAQKKWVHYA
jgi:multiple sugar transport system permease protein